jgi:ClpP class serine protease
VAGYFLTQQVLAQYGGPIFCLDARAIGKAYRLHADRPGPECNERVTWSHLGAARVSPRSEVVTGDDPAGSLSQDMQLDPPEPLSIVRIDGPIEQRAAEHECGGWTDGHDAVAERMIEAFEIGDVVLVIDSPGGAYAGMQESVRRVVAAKAAKGRHVYVYADEQIGSAAYWWACSVADPGEIYAPESACVGSIGARGQHDSIAGALAIAGIAPTFFAWPDEGKVAFAPELPLSELGKERGDRDIRMCGEAFAAVVAASRGISIDDIKKLRADALPGRLALASRLIDGIAPLEDVLQYALSRANAGDMTMADPVENPAPAKPGAAEPPPAPPEANKLECPSCGQANEADAKFCDQCGKPTDGTEPEASDDEPDGDEAPPAAPPKKEESAAAAAAPAPAALGNSLPKILGLHADASIAAQKGAAVALASLAATAMSLTGTRSPDAAAGALQSMAVDAAEVAKLRAEAKASAKRENYRDRMDALLMLAKLNDPKFPRGDLFVDKEVGGKIVATPAPMFAEMKLSTLKGLVSARVESAKTAIANGKGPRVTPFEPDPKLLEQQGKGVTEADRETAQKYGYKPEDVAATRTALFGATGA